MAAPQKRIMRTAQNIIIWLWSLWAWRHVADLGVWAYYENTITGKRKAVKLTNLPGPRHSQWLAGGAWEQQRPPPPPPIRPRREQNQKSHSVLKVIDRDR